MHQYRLSAGRHLSPRFGMEGTTNLLKNHFGRNPYFERRNGRHPMPPEEQQVIRQALERVGVASTMEFDDYKDAILW